MRKALLAIAGVIVLALIVSALAWERMPERMASHWNAAGEADSTMPKTAALLLLPGIAIALSALLLLLPRIDPLKRNVDAFLPDYERFVLALVALLSYLHVVMVLANLGTITSLPRALAPGFAVFTFALASLLARTRRNWFLGVRTPWTLSSDKVWERTHALARKLFMAASAIMLLGVLFPRIAFLLITLPLVGAALVSVVYSYVAYREEMEK